MHTLAAGSWVFAVLLAMAGVAKLSSPAATAAALQGARLPSDARLVRMLGIAEIALGAAVLLVGGPVPAATLSAAYLAFAGFAWRQSRAGEGCGCFGEASAPATTVHVAIDVAGALFAGAAAWWPVGSPLAHAGSPVAAGLAVALTLLAAVLLRMALTALPELAEATRAVTTAGEA